MAKIRTEVQAEPEQLFAVTEFFRPRVEEMCALLPVALGRRVQASPGCRRVLGCFTGGKRLRTDTIPVFLLLRTLAGLRRWRRSTLGYSHEHALIQRWLQAVRYAAGRDRALALELVECGRLVKGYGDTRARTTAQMQAILAHAAGDAVSADSIATLREAALADDEGRAFALALAA